MALNTAKGHKDTIRIVFVKKIPKNAESYKRWSKHLRKYVHGFNYEQIRKTEGGSILCPIQDIDTKEKIGELVCEMFGAGIWQVRGYSNAKTRTTCKPVTLAEVRIAESKHGDSIVANVKVLRASRYWFFKR